MLNDDNMERIQNIPKELISNTTVVDYKTPISAVMTHLKKYPAVIVNKEDEYFGLVDSKTIYKAMHSLKLSNSEKADKFSVNAPRVTNSTPIYDLVSYFYKLGIKSLPYSNGKKVIGVLERKTLLKVLLSLNMLKDMDVGQSMTTPVLAIDAKANIAQAKATMRERNVNRLVVLQNSRFAGLITNYDITKKYAKASERLPEMKTEIYTPTNVPISSVMEKNVRTIEFNRNVADAVRDMVENNISSLVVLKNGDPIGLLTVTDIFENILARQKVAPSRIFMSGFDANTYQYEDDAREALTSFAEHVERLSGIDIDYITLKVKRTHSKLYEMQIRVSLGRHGIVSMHNTKYLFDDSLNDLLTKLKHKIIKEKESILTHKKVNTLREAE